MHKIKDDQTISTNQAEEIFIHNEPATIYTYDGGDFILRVDEDDNYFWLNSINNFPLLFGVSSYSTMKEVIEDCPTEVLLFETKAEFYQFMLAKETD